MVPLQTALRFLSVPLLVVGAVLVGAPFFSPAEAQQPAPSLCNGYNPETHVWGAIGIRYTLDGKGYYCPDGYAYFATSPNLGVADPGRYLPISGDCCPIADDILTNVHEFQLESCSDGYVATGARQEASDGKHIQYSIRCTKINTERYQLGETREGLQWGLERDFRHLLQGVKTIGWSQIPLGIRYGIGRLPGNRPGQWANEGCIGFPFGSLLVAKHNKRCSGMLFRELQYTGAKEGDPPAGTAVQLIPECAAVLRPSEPDAQCLK